MTRNRSSWIGTWLLVLASAAGTLSAEEVRAKEYQVKAAVLLQVAKFVEWPASAFAAEDAPIVLGILGEDPFGPMLDQTFKGETAQGRRLAVRRFPDLKTIEPCHLLFVAKSEEEHLPEVFEAVKKPALKTMGILTASEIPAFAEKGGVLHIDVIEKRLQMRINTEAADRSRLKISSKLLRLAKIVKDVS